ncbi:MAG: SRPBCC domain-containing protein [Rhizobiaceae bacterium]|nr:SRPBCC domain-containing protein [Rhizobiaceae bacterium]
MSADTDENEVVVDCELDAPPEKVWRALTVPELVAEWLAVAPAADGNEPAYAIVEATPFTRLRYAWRDDESSRPHSLVTFELWPQADGRTRFRLTHTALPPAANANGTSTMLRAA